MLSASEQEPATSFPSAPTPASWDPTFELTDGFVISLYRATDPVTDPVTGQDRAWLEAVLRACQRAPQKSQEIQPLTGIKHRETLQRNYLSRLQKYRLTAKGKARLEELGSEN